MIILSIIYMNAYRCVSAVVPAFNEEKTIREVILALLCHDAIREVIVVDDGSTDRTVQEVFELKAQSEKPIKIIELRRNCGKSAAMNAGVSAAKSSYIFFCDADVIGLHVQAIDRILAPVLSKKYAMYVGVRERKIYWMNALLRFTPILGGERALSKELWYKVPTSFKKNFQIEIALNYFSKRMPGGMGFELMPGVSQIIKEKKYGLLLGLIRRFGMMWDIVVVAIKVYGLESVRQVNIGWSFVVHKTKIIK